MCPSKLEEKVSRCFSYTSIYIHHVCPHSVVISWLRACLHNFVAFCNVVAKLMLGGDLSYSTLSQQSCSISYLKAPSNTPSVMRKRNRNKKETSCKIDLHVKVFFLT